MAELGGAKSARSSWVYLPYLIVVLVGIASVLPMRDYSSGGHDFFFHRLNTHHFQEQLAAGQLYPRWLPKMNAGLGSPVMYFYPPLPYYINSLFLSMAHLPSLAFNDLAVSSGLALIVSGSTALLWFGSLVPPFAALVGALVYMLFPYHFSIDLYERFAFAELWTFAWIPLAMYWARLIPRGSMKAVIGLGFALALLVMTHLPTALIFSLLPLLYALIHKGNSNVSWGKLARQLSMAYVLAAGLSAIYWLPAITTQEWVSMEGMSTGEFHYSNHFLFEGSNRYKNFRKLIEITTIYSLLTGFLAWLITLLLGRKPMKKEARFHGSVTLAALFLMLSPSAWIWSMLPVIQRIQFPWRFQVIYVLAVSALIAVCVDAIRQRWGTPFGQAWTDHKRNVVFIVSTLCLVSSRLLILDARLWVGAPNLMTKAIRFLALLAILILTVQTLKPPWRLSGQRLLVIGFWMGLFLLVITQSYMKIFSSRVDDTDREPMKLALAAPEHRPKWVKAEELDPGALARWSSSTPQVRISEGSGTISLLQWQATRILLQASSEKAMTIEVKQLFYPSWTATSSDRLKELVIKPSENGLVKIGVPAGDHRISLTIRPLFVERLGATLSGLSFGICALLMLTAAASGERFEAARFRPWRSSPLR
jgi:hypothetical protein